MGHYDTEVPATMVLTEKIERQKNEILTVSKKLNIRSDQIIMLQFVFNRVIPILSKLKHQKVKLSGRILDWSEKCLRGQTFGNKVSRGKAVPEGQTVLEKTVSGTNCLTEKLSQ